MNLLWLSSRMELRCVIAVIRHGDRTPKQKMKMEVRNPMWVTCVVRVKSAQHQISVLITYNMPLYLSFLFRFFDLFEKYGGYKTGKLKLKKPKQLQVTVTGGLIRHLLSACFTLCSPWTVLQEVLDITRQLLADLGQHNDCEIEEKKSKLEQLKTVLEMWVHLQMASCKVPGRSHFLDLFRSLSPTKCFSESQVWLLVLSLVKS